MANTKIQATATLFLDTKNAQRDAKQFVEDIRQKLSDIESAADKMKVFKDVVEYISQIDRALSALRANNKDAFTHMFDGLDGNLRKQLEGLFGVDGSHMKQLDALREKLGTLTTRSGIEEIRKFAKEINAVYVAAGKAQPFEDIKGTFTGRVTQEYINSLTEKVVNFGKIWSEINAQVSQGFGGSGGGFSGPSKEIQEEIDRLENQKKEYKEIIDFFNGKKVKIKIDKSNDADTLRKLREEMQATRAEVDRLEKSGMKGSDQYIRAVAQYTKAAATFKDAYDRVYDNGSKKGIDYTLDTGVMDSYNEAEEYLKKFFKNQQGMADAIKRVYTDLVTDVDAKISKLQNPIDDKKAIPSFDVLSAKLKEIHSAMQQLDNYKFGTSQYVEAERVVQQLTDNFIKLYVAQGQLDDVNDILFGLADYDLGDKDYVEQLTKLCNLLGVEIPKAATVASESISTTGSGNTSGAVETIGDAADTSKKRVDALTESIKRAFIQATELELSGAKSKETMNLFGVDGTISSSVGINQRVDTDTIVSQLISNLKNNMIMSLHNHANGNDMFSPQDLESFAKLYYGQGTKINGIIVDGMVKTIDFTGISQELAIKIAQSYAEGIQSIVSNNSNLLTYKDGHIDYTDFARQLEVTNPDVYKEVILAVQSEINECLNNAFLQNGVQPTIKQFEHTQLPELAKHLSEIQQNAQASLSPVEKLQNLLSAMYPDRTFNWGDYTEIFDKFSSGAIDGTQAINKILNLDTVSSQVDQAKAKVESFLALAREIQSTSFNQLFDARDNVKIGEYTERLNQATNELEMFGKQNLLTAEQVASVRSALRAASSHLEASTRGYDSYSRDSIALSYYDEYKEEQRRADASEGEAHRLQRQLEILKQIAEIDKQIGLTYDHQVDQLDALVSQRRRLLAETEVVNTLDLETLNTQVLITQEYAERSKYIHDRYNQAESDFHNEIANLSNSNVSAMNLEEIERYISRLTELYNIIKEADKNYLVGDFGKIDTAYSGAISSLNEAKAKLTTGTSIGGNIVGVDTEIGKLEVLKAKLLETKAAVDAKTVAFEEEHATVDAAVDAEVSYLQKLIDKLAEVIAQIKLVTDGFAQISANTTSLNVGSKSTSTGSAADNVASAANIVNEQIKSVDLVAESEQLGKLRTILISVKKAVVSKTKAFNEEGKIVGEVVDKEITALKRLSDIVDNITPKINSIVAGFAVINKQRSPKKITETPSKHTTSTTSTTTGSGQTAFDNEKQKQIAAFEKYYQSVEHADYMTEELKRDLEDFGRVLRSVANESDLSKLGVQFDGIKRNIDAARNGFEKFNLGAINSVERELTTAFSKLGTEQKSAIAGELQDALIVLEKYKASVEDGKKIELESIDTVVSALREKIKAYEAQNGAVAQGKSNKKFGSTAFMNAQLRVEAIRNQASSQQFANSPVVVQGLKQLEDAYQRLIDKKRQLESSDTRTKEDELEYRRLTKECNSYATALERVIKNSTKLRGESATKPYVLGDDFVDNAQGREAALTAFVQQLDGVDASTISFKKNYEECIFTINNGDGTVSKMTARFTDARNEIVTFANETKKTTSAVGHLWNEFKKKLGSVGTYFAASFSLYRVWAVIKQGVQYVKEIDGALTELKKVTDETGASYKQFLQDMSKTGAVIGATVADLTSSAADWARLGYSMQEAGELAKNTSILMNVSEFEDVSKATDTLISALQAFKKEGTDVSTFSMEIIDKYNEVGNNYAISTSDLADSLTRSSAALVAANNSIEEAIAMTTAANTTIQDPESVGNALKTVSMRIRGVKTE